MQFHPLAFGVILHLVQAEAADVEVERGGMREVEPADGGARRHRKVFGQLDAGVAFGAEQVEQDPLLGVIGAGGVAGGGADAAVAFGDQGFLAQVFALAIAPPAAHEFVQPLGEGLGQSVGQCLDHDRLVIIVIGLELGDQFGDAMARRDGKPAEIVEPAAFARRDEIGQAVVRFAVGALPLLAQEVERGKQAAAAFVGVDFDIIADGVGRMEENDAAGAQTALANDALEQPARVVIELAGFGAPLGMIQNPGEDPLHLPGVEERSPVDVTDEFVDGVIIQHAQAAEFGGRDVERVPIGTEGVGPGVGVGDQGFLFAAAAMVLAQRVVLGPHARGVFVAALGIEQRLDDADDARGVLDVNGRGAVLQRDLDGGVQPAGGGAADQQRQREALALHFARDMDHLVERGGDQAGQADDVDRALAGDAQEFLARNHHAQIDDLVIVAAEDDADDVLADIVHVALDGRHQDAALGGGGGAQPLLLLLHKGEQVSDRLFHDAGALDDLGQKHLAGAEEVADDIHAVHQRTFDDLQRAVELAARLLDVLVDEFHDPLDQGVLQPFVDRQRAPGLGFLLRFAGAFGLDAVGKLDQPFGGVGAAVEQDVLDPFEQFLVDLFIHFDHAGVDDGHVEAGLARMVEEGGVHRLADAVVAAERERDVADAAADATAGEPGLDQPGGLDEGDAVGVVLLHAGGDGQHVGVEDDVAGVPAFLVDENAVGAFADRQLAVGGIGLAGFVEGHHDGGRAEPAQFACVLAEHRFAFLQADRVDDGLALDAAQRGLDHRPARAVDHDRDLADVGLGGDQVEEAAHDGFRIDQALIHVDVDHVGAVVDLLAGDGDGGVEVALADGASR
ncbi:MAG: hypothetical protein BWZ08_00202 [candidate division BRC1 bacterium ADurb.BinA292]|nr:MAG: hypothetical protein BWZ08_00202 [candidate division BRC1 bacterium ADurb.BinA292]